MVYWGSPYMAHTMMSFGFEGGDYLWFSIETRKTKGQGYSAIKGLFRQFELISSSLTNATSSGSGPITGKGEEVYLFRLTRYAGTGAQILPRLPAPPEPPPAAARVV